MNKSFFARHSPISSDKEGHTDSQENGDEINEPVGVPGFKGE